MTKRNRKIWRNNLVIAGLVCVYHGTTTASIGAISNAMSIATSTNTVLWCDKHSDGFKSLDHVGFDRFIDYAISSQGLDVSREDFLKSLQIDNPALSNGLKGAGQYVDAFLAATCDAELLHQFSTFKEKNRKPADAGDPMSIWKAYVKATRAGDYLTMINHLAGRYQQQHLDKLVDGQLKQLQARLGRISEVTVVNQNAQVVELELMLKDGKKLPHYLKNFDGQWKIMNTRPYPDPIYSWADMGGWVVDEKGGHAVAGAHVMAAWYEDDNCIHVAATTTDATGHYQLAAWDRPDKVLPMGVYQRVEISVYYPGFRSREDVRIHPLDKQELRMNSHIDIQQDYHKANQRAMTLEKLIHSNRQCHNLKDGSDKNLYAAYNAMAEEVSQMAKTDHEQHRAKKLHYESLNVLEDHGGGTVLLPSGEVVSVEDPGEYRPQQAMPRTVEKPVSRKPGEPVIGYGEAGRPKN